MQRVVLREGATWKAQRIVKLGDAEFIFGGGGGAMLTFFPVETFGKMISRLQLRDEWGMRFPGQG